MKTCTLFYTCLLASSLAFAYDSSSSSANEPTRIKDMKGAADSNHRATRTAGRSADPNTGMADPKQDTTSNLKYKKDRSASTSSTQQSDTMDTTGTTGSSTTATGVGATNTSGRDTMDHATTTTDTSKSSGSYGAAGTATGNDRNVTADQHPMNERDVAITRQIRQEIMSNKDLSTRAHNLTVVTDSGKVTIRGTVPSDAEKSSVEQIARGVSGVSSVTNQVTVSR
jgi:hyperosmotically inducible protein